MENQSLAANEMMDMLDIIHATLNCQTMERLQELTQDMQQLLGCCQSVFCWKSLGPGALHGAPDILNISFPEPFLEALNRDELWKDNPVAIRGMMHQGLQSWQETFKQMTPSKQLFDLKHSFDLHKGYSFTVHGAKGGTMLSIGDFEEQDLVRRELILSRLMPHFHMALANVLEKSADEDEFPPLTGREIEVLSWLKDGKTSWEISVILDISERTINFHVANVKKKLNASNRMNAVAQAMHLGLVC